MSWRFRNSYGTTVWVVIMWYTPGCSDGGDWSKKGWWSLEPGETKTVLGGDLEDINRYFYYYGETGDRTTQWAGSFFTCIPQTAFDWCLNTCDTNPETRNLGLREVDIGDYDTYTVNLTS